MSGACGTFGGQLRCIQGYGGETLVERDHLENLGVEGVMLLNWSSRSGMGEHGLGFSDSGWGQVVGACECVVN